jgi:adenosylhomocysteine nucleosidase
MRRIGVMAAMPEELDAVLGDLDADAIDLVGGRRFHRGRLHGVEAVLVISRCGKVAAAGTATLLLERYGVDAIVFTGLAGGAAPALRIGDIVVADRLIQHDLDARPLFPRYEVPLLGVSVFGADPAWARSALSAAERFVTRSQVLLGEIAAELGLAAPRVHHGLIASGDQFFASAEAIAELRERLPDALCVEMEGAAVAQVCHEYGAPVCVIRTISDTADHAAHLDFPRFLTRVCGVYARALIEGTIDGMTAGAA